MFLSESKIYLHKIKLWMLKWKLKLKLIQKVFIWCIVTVKKYVFSTCYKSYH